MTDTLKPSVGLLVKLGSLIVHYQELNSRGGHEFDKSAIDTLENDPEVRSWLDHMTKVGFLPLKR